jgi:hypothetical protein
LGSGVLNGSGQATFATTALSAGGTRVARAGSPSDR